MEDRGNGMIRPIASDAVRRIVAGQAVTDLASCVKELVDNALDANSKTINVRLFNQGVDIVEVSDDGCGVPMCSRPLLALPHATNKIHSMEDIYNRAGPLTLGFRGEALFCLANLSARLVIATRTAEEELAQKMEFSRDGSLIVESVVDIPRKVGTTVAVVKLFETVPVRQADMKRHIQNQRSRMMKIMEAYAIFSVGVCINVIDIATDGNGKESRLLATTINSTRLEETITAVLGIRFMVKLSPIDIDIASALEEEEGQTTDSDASQPRWGVQGFISTASPVGSSESNRNDRCVQYYCINGRPVELPQITRLMNDIWRTTFGQSKRPSCILMFTLPCHSFDVNVSPDKRDVIFPTEQKISELMQQKISELWASQTHGKFTQQIIDSSSSSNNNNNDVDVEESKKEERVVAEMEGSPRRFKRRHAFSHDFTKAKLQHESDDRRLSPQALPDQNETIQMDNSVDDQEPSNESDSNPSYKRRRSRSACTAYDEDDDDTPTESSKLLDVLTNSAVTPSPANQCLPNDNMNQSIQLRDVIKVSAAEKAGWRRVQKSFNDRSSDDLDRTTVSKRPRQTVEADVGKKQGTLTEYGFESLGYRAVKRVSFDPSRSSHDSGDALQQTRTSSVDATSHYGTRRVSGESTGSVPQSTRNDKRHDHVNTSGSKWSSSDNHSESFNATTGSQSTVDQSIECDSQEESEASLPEVIWKSFQSTEAIIAASQQYNAVVEERNKRLRDTIRQHASAHSDKDNTPPTSSQTTIGLSKEDLGKNMTIIGQFNMGFILAHTPDYHLWILDQHGCDEKRLFEKLCVETKIHEQRLMAPLPIELSPTEETCVIDHMDVFEKNGFRFQVDETKPPRHRLALIALPHSGAADGRKAVQFGKEDVVALCEILGVDGSLSSYDTPSGCGTGADGSGMYGNNAVRRYNRTDSGNSTARIIARLPKAIAMFASRACRGSIMIGQALNETEMKRITTRLGDLEHPWQCPHGRPTINHIGNLSQTLLNDEQRVTEYRLAGTLSSDRDC